MLTKYQLIEAKIEHIVYLEYNQLDQRLTRNEIDQDTYNEEARAIDEWAREMYDEAWLKERV